MCSCFLLLLLGKLSLCSLSLEFAFLHCGVHSSSPCSCCAHSRAHASSYLFREDLLAFPLLRGTCLFSLWSPSFLLHVSALITLYLAEVQLSLTLTLSDLTILRFGHRALFLFLLARAALAYLPTVPSEALSPLLIFRQAQCAQVFLLKSASFCKLFAGLRSFIKSVTSFLLSDSLSVTTPCFFLHLFFYFNFSGGYGRNCLLSPPTLSGYNGSPDTRFSR